MLLTIDNLHASVHQKDILKGLNLQVDYGQVHAIMGPNGAGKSTLSKLLAGHPDYKVTAGHIHFEVNGKAKDITEWTPDERAKDGLFLAYQYPVEIPGVSNSEFLRASLNATLVHQGSEELDPLDFHELLKQKMAFLGIDEGFAQRHVNVGFSGGEKKRNEILQMAVLAPRLAVLDEIDSGLDVDALKQVALGIETLRSKDNAIIIITHYQRLLDYIVPDVVHILAQGRIVASGPKELAQEVELHGYDGLKSSGGYKEGTWS